jgi:hypothetical protein
MGRGLCLVGLHPLDFGFEQGDTLVEFAKRIAFQAFPGKERGSIATLSRAIIVFHCGPTFQAISSLSTGARRAVVEPMLRNAIAAAPNCLAESGGFAYITGNTAAPRGAALIISAGETP